MSDAADQLTASSQQTDRPAGAKVTLQSLTDEFVERLMREFSQRVARRPRAFKKSVLRLLASRLPPHPRPAGRPNLPLISQATRLYLQAKQQKQEGTIPRIPWSKIAAESMSDWHRIQSPYRRRVMLDRLRNAVYARLRRCQITPPSRGQ